jgi:hypothetical protein
MHHTSEFITTINKTVTHTKKTFKSILELCPKLHELHLDSRNHFTKYYARVLNSQHIQIEHIQQVKIDYMLEVMLASGSTRYTNFCFKNRATITSLVLMNANEDKCILNNGGRYKFIFYFPNLKCLELQDQSELNMNFFGRESIDLEDMLNNASNNLEELKLDCYGYHLSAMNSSLYIAPFNHIKELRLQGQDFNQYTGIYHGTISRV